MIRFLQLIGRIRLWIIADFKVTQIRALTVFFALDHAVLAIVTLGKCKQYEMISSALWSLEMDRKVMGIIFRPVVDKLLRPLGANHCYSSYMWQLSLYEATKHLYNSRVT